MAEEEKKLYEMGTIFSPEIEEASLHEQIAEVETLITNAGGDIVNTDVWGLQDFAYPIRKKSSGYYVFYYFNAGSDAPHKIRDNIKLNENVLRHIIIINKHMIKHQEKDINYGTAKEQETAESTLQEA